ncbi:MAG: TIGR00730 family Rossman fold protein, partial [Gammaproteobacteria bacterium]|nr:TIGR00730 family Rossman fold protein [Gammaproteobacteria bacterium]
MKKVCVFCGSSSGKRAEYAEAAIDLGRELVRQNIGLVYGGGDVGLMGIIADTVMSEGGEVTGVIPQFLAQKEVAHKDLTELRIVDSMHERKALMSELSDGFIALPGGIGTFEELIEVLTWQQLGVQAKPCAVLNTCAYFEHMLEQLDHAV